MTNRGNARPGAWQHSGRAQQTVGTTHQPAGSVALPRPVYNGRGAVVGELVSDPDGSVWLTKRGLDPSRHRLREPEGWATDTAHLDMLRAAGGAGIRLHLVNGTTWEATLAQWERHGIPVHRGHGPQRVLPSRYWTVHQPGARQLVLL